ncbi:MAG: flagellar hook-associated protein FlgK [Myxococcota bacterium]|nr:flagellar hook-associated protein FlgK [Myxococcota bacterium]
MGILSTLNVGSTGLQVAADAIQIVGHNATNAATEGYSRQLISTGSASPILQAGFWMGQGVGVTDIGRATNLFVAERAISAQGDASSAETALSAHQFIETSVASESGPPGQLSAFFDALEELANDPSSDSYRSVALSAAESLTDSIRTVASDMSALQTTLADEVEATVDGVNDSLSRIAQLNGLIGQGGSPDLMDERDAIITDLAATLGATVDYAADGGATVFIGGHAAVMDSSAREVSVVIGSNGFPAIKLSVDNATVTVTDDVGGAVGGALEGWQAAQTTLDSMDTFVTEFATAFNTQHAAGFDATATAGGDVFSFSATDPAASFTLVLTDIDGFAAAADPSAPAGDRGNLDLLIELKDLGAVSGQGASDFMTDVVQQIASAVSSAELSLETDTAALDDAAALMTSISGVDLDAEAADLLAWQAAYQAAARVITVTDEMLGELMNLV